MKKTLALIVLLAIVGVGVSIFLVPRAGELALINFKDKHFSTAREAYEAQLREGALTPEVVNNLVTLYLQDGSLNEATAVMERYIETRPADIEARKRLGQLYQYAGRQDDYQRNLEEIARLNPSPESIAELSQIYNFKGEYDKQAEALKSLIAAEQGVNAQRYIDLANIQAPKARQEAIATLQELQAKHPEAFTFREQELLTSLLLDEKRTDDAYASALAWRQKNPPAAESARLINLLHFKGAPPQAEQLLASYEKDAIEAEPALLTEQVLIWLDTGRENEAYTRLKQLHADGKLSAGLQNRLLFLAIARADNETASKLLSTLDVKTLNESEAMALLELSVSKGDAAMQRQLAQAYGAEEYKASFPILTSMLSVAGRKPEAKERLDALANTQLTAQQNLQIARVCLRLKEFSCSERFLSRLPDTDALSDADVAAIGNLYLELKAYEKGNTFITRMAQTRKSPLIEEVRVKFAAVRGDEKTVSAWLAANPDASNRTLSDLYFASYNNKHQKLAARVAETLFTRTQSADARSYLAQAYVATGDYAKAVALLREARTRSAADESNYLFALTKLAARDASYKRELGAYASARLNGNLPHERKLALIYALIAADQTDVAMPYIRVLAMNEGGQWAWLYADRLTKAGRHEEARAFWVQLAASPRTPLNQRNAIAYNLLEGGYPADAEPIFRRLASDAPPSSEAVQRLLYVWGPRLNAAQLDWLAERYNSASDTDRAAWARIISQRAGGEELIPFAETRHPETLFAPEVLSAYTLSLAKNGELKDKHPALLQGITEQSDPALLAAYARAAEAGGNPRAAREAYAALFALQPADNDTLRRLGILSFAQADYTASRSYFEEYMRAGGLDSDAPEHAQAAAYYYAELLRHAKAPEAAAPYYDYAVQMTNAAQLSTPEALSRKGMSLIWLNRADEGIAVLRAASEANPQNDVLRADLIGSLIETERYDEARALLAQVDTETPQESAQALALPPGLTADYAVSADGTQALIRLSGSDDDLRQFASNAESLPWVAYTSLGYRQALVVAKPGWRIAPVQGQLAASSDTNDEAARQARLRHALLAARTDLETGHVYDATRRLNALMPEYPNDAQLLGFAANAEHYAGNTHRASALLSVARTLAPENEDIALLHRDIRRVYTQHVKLDHEWVKRGKNNEQISTLSAQVNATPDFVISAVAQNDYVRAKNIRRADGRVGNFTKNRQRAELSAAYHRDNGDRAKISLFANNDTPGVGVYYEFLNKLGASGVGVEYHKPYWDYIEGVLDDATRDRISFWHSYKPDTRWAIRFEPGLNRYNVNRFDNVASSWSVDAQVVYRPIENIPYLYLGYGLSAEYFLDKDYKFDSGNNAYLALPTQSREVHFLSVNSGYEFDAHTYADGMLGWGYDRLGGTGPMAEAKITHEFTDYLDAQLRASYGLDTRESENDILRVGGYLRVRF